MKCIGVETYISEAFMMKNMRYAIGLHWLVNQIGVEMPGISQLL